MANRTSVKIILGTVTASHDSDATGTFAKEIKDFLDTTDNSVGTAASSGSMGRVHDIEYVTTQGYGQMVAIITLSGSLPS